MKWTKLLTLGLALSAGTLVIAQPKRGEFRDRHSPDFEVPEELQSLADEVAAARDALKASREEVIEALGEEVDREAIEAALEIWREENAEAIDAAKALAAELREALLELAPEEYERPERDPPPEEVVALRDEAKALHESLKASREEAIDALGEDATEEEIKAALDAWREAHADDFARLEEIREEVRTYLRENRPERGERGGASEAVRERREAFRETSQELRAAREALREALDAAETEEERRALIEEFREEQRELMQERKELRRLELIDGVSGGDRRSGG